ncbi:ICOS ligand-like isoform X2 [Polypterus senegalus]|uniref:ICOS ligand-like isoform X2 n=1 Tax=Polypterus senegalus TaxID=55291 RepID=UPI0019628CDB|nr:ICOS ligand-like isoform X2 [Polypterus senegalus]
MAHMWRNLCLILLSLADAYAEDCLPAIIGETVQIPCSLHTTESLKTEDISLEWETSKGDIVHAFVKGEDHLSNQDPQFRGRTQLFRSELSRGNFSLSLSNVSAADVVWYDCRFSRSEEESSTFLCHQCLQIAESYSVPVVYGQSAPMLKNKEAYFTCVSTGGFPAPKVQWSVNKQPVQDSSRVDTRLSRDSRGLYSVTSVLTVIVTGDMFVSCTVENERLTEKRTSAENEYQIETVKKLKVTNRGARVTGMSVPVVLLIGAIVTSEFMRSETFKNNHNPAG